jgi:hypothetical protein
LLGSLGGFLLFLLLFPVNIVQALESLKLFCVLRFDFVVKVYSCQFAYFLNCKLNCMVRYTVNGCKSKTKQNKIAILPCDIELSFVFYVDFLLVRICWFFGYVSGCAKQ